LGCQSHGRDRRRSRRIRCRRHTEFRTVF
jgi:hypothetical protein